MGFAEPETNFVTYVAMTNEINIEEHVDTSPRNWIPKGQYKPLNAGESREETINHYDLSRKFNSLHVSNTEKCKKLIKCQ